jgi:hypothetical protein
VAAPVSSSTSFRGLLIVSTKLSRSAPKVTKPVTRSSSSPWARVGSGGTGFNVHPLPGVTFRTGLQMPVRSARQFDYTLHSALVWEF